MAKRQKLKDSFVISRVAGSIKVSLLECVKEDKLNSLSDLLDEIYTAFLKGRGKL